MPGKTGKLVRDGIPAIIRAEGRDPVVRVLSGPALSDALNEKLVEEHGEYRLAAGGAERLEELADLLEVVCGMAHHAGFSKKELFDQCDKKRRERGGFEKGFFYEGCKKG